jgi:signal transduction histidine kinase/ActR/RegA family two-component response regulator
MAWLDAQIPRELLADERTALRARAVVVASLVYLVINSFIGLLVIPVFVGDRPGAALVEVLLGVAGGACTLLLRATRSVPLTANVLVGLGVLNIWSMSYLSGGADGAVLSCFIVIPFVAYALTDARTGAVWLAVTWVSALALSALGDYHPSWPERFPRPAVVEGFLIAGLASGFYVVQAIYHRLYQASLLRQEAAQHAAEAANRAKSAFLAAMSHELRTPMNGVLGVSDVLLRQSLPPDVQDMVGIIRRSSEALLGILNQILDLAKIEAGRFELEAIPFRADELLREVQTLTALVAQQKGLRLELDGVDTLDGRSFRGDPLRLRQILLNLLGNAIKFTEAGEVRLTARRTEGALVLAVTDTGPGISEEVQRKLFQPFQQADASTTRRHGGTGLGLVISRQLAELMGGTLALTSQLGRGSTFTLTLPLEEVAAEAAELARATAEVPALPLPSHVLLVEDNTVNQLVARRLLTSLGVNVTVAANGVEALDRVRGVDLVLMDCQMPVMDGLEATRRIRALSGPERTVPIVALSAAVFQEERQATVEAGMDAFLPKPLRLDELEGTLRTVWRDACARRVAQAPA